MAIFSIAKIAFSLRYQKAHATHSPFFTIGRPIFQKEGFHIRYLFTFALYEYIHATINQT